MSIQFRTKSQTVVDYSAYISTKEVDGCCQIYDNETNTVEKLQLTVAECHRRNGYFSGGECSEVDTITPSSLGCCCACKLNETEGKYTKQTTLCECDSLSGLWTLGSDCTDATEDSLCISGTLQQSNKLDFRNKRACCHPAFNEDGEAYAKCEDVCTEKECADFAAVPYQSTFYTNGRRCEVSVNSARPVSDDCVLSETNVEYINSCSGGTNLFCWTTQAWGDNQHDDSSTAGGGRGYRACNLKFWFDVRFAGRFVDRINGFALKIRNEDIPNSYDLILAPSKFSQELTGSDEAKTSTPIGCNKISFGTHTPASYAESIFDGYFAILDGNDYPKYYSTQSFRNEFANNPAYSPIPRTPQNVSFALDIIATPFFSAYIDQDNNLKFFGRYEKDNQFKLMTITDKLKKLYKHNILPIPGGYSSSVGFIGQKLDGSFEYYSPFINEDQLLQKIRDMVRSIPAKNYINASFSVFSFCGIDSTGTMSCVSTGSELNFPVNRKYKLVSCSMHEYFENSNVPLDPANEYCFAVDIDNRVTKIGTVQFVDPPVVSYTDVIDLSCIDGICFAVVEPDLDVCNNQMIGCCCVCDVDIFSCLDQTTQGECNRLNGAFTQGGFCRTAERPNGVECANIELDCNDSSNTFRLTIQSENNLPTSELSYYKDGLYVGIFEPGRPINPTGSVLNGNPTTGLATEYTSTVNSYGSMKNRWALIVAPFDYEYSSIMDEYELNEILPSSLHDGAWNTYGDNNLFYGIQTKMMEQLRKKSRVSGWYLPSKNELEFINAKMNHGFFIPEVFKSISSDLYLTSTAYYENRSDGNFSIDNQVFNGKSFMYAQSFKKSDYGATYLVPRTDKINIRLVRRIELE